MKKQVFALLLALLLLSGCSGPVHPQTETPAWPETPAPEAVSEPAPEPGQETEQTPNVVDLYFPANPTTGYSWTAEIEDPGIAELDEQYFPDGELPGLVGAGGKQWYRIRGTAEGVTSVTFRYARPWESSAIYTFVYRLQVDANNNVLIWGVEMGQE